MAYRSPIWRKYYLTNDEIAILESSAAEMVRRIPSGSMVVELGSG